MDVSRLTLQIYGPDLINVESEPVMESDLDWLPKLKEYMVSTMRRCNGVGLAAPQLGVFKRYVVIELKNGAVIDLINPDITKMYGREIDGLEGCLSLPPGGNECPVPRMECVDVEAEGTAYGRKRWEFRRDDARVVQHELDHLTGTFFIDRVSDKRRRQVLERFVIWKREWERQGKPFPWEGNENARVARTLSTYCR